MNELPLYLLMITFNRKASAISIINQFNAAEKPTPHTTFLVVENGSSKNLEQEINPVSNTNVYYYHFNNKNKAAAINFAIKNLIAEQEALVVCIDDDISFKKDYLSNYYKTAIKKRNKFYFGSSFFVNLPKVFDRRLIPYLSGSALGQPDEQFEKMEKLMFLGFSYSFFKSQWTKVGGLDERFSPGSKYDLAAEESIFQKKLHHAGYKPNFVKKNVVEHRPEPHLYTKKMVRFRQEQNGFTHGFQNLISSTYFLKLNCLKQMAGHLKGCVILGFEKDRLAFSMKLAYTKGFLRSFLLFLKFDDNRNYLTNNKN